VFFFLGCLSASLHHRFSPSLITIDPAGHQSYLPWPRKHEWPKPIKDPTPKPHALPSYSPHVSRKHTLPSGAAPLSLSQHYTLAQNCQPQFANHKVLHHRPQVARPHDSMSRWGLGAVLCCAGGDTRSSSSRFLSQSVATQEDATATTAAQELWHRSFSPFDKLSRILLNEMIRSFVLPCFFFRAHPPAYPCPCQPGSLLIFLASMPLTT